MVARTGPGGALPPWANGPGTRSPPCARTVCGAPGGHRGERVGEAANPGPQGDECRLITANITSWSSGEAWALARAEDVVCLQEHRLTGERLAAAEAAGRRAGWSGIWEPAKRSEKWGPASGGVSILARAPRRIARVPWADADGADAGRVVHGVVECGARCLLYMFNVYG